jgi:hypothetical protein
MPEWYISTIIFRFRSNSTCKFFPAFLLAVLLITAQAKAFDRRSLFSIFDSPGQPLKNSMFTAEKEKENNLLNEILFLSSPENNTSRAFIKAASVMQDGEQKEFSVRITGGDAADYEWSYETRGKAKTPALIEFSSPKAAATQVLARWYARTHGGCSADFTSLYLIKLKIKLRNGKELIEKFPLTVEVPHNWGGYVDYPETSGTPQIVFDQANQVWRVTGAGTLARIVKKPVVKAIHTSQFFHKIYAHEEIHQQQMENGLFADLFQINDLMPLIKHLSDSNRQRLEQKIFEITQQWRANEVKTAITRLPKAEKEAYAVSDQIEPKYLFNNCERYK